MNTVQAGMTIPLRAQWVWHYVSDPLNWPAFLPHATAMRHTHGDHFELFLEGVANHPIHCKLVLVSREPTERLEWRILAGPLRGHGALLIQRHQHHCRLTVELELERSGRGQAVLALPVETVQLALERKLEALAATLTGRTHATTTAKAEPAKTLEPKAKPIEPSTRAAVRALN